MGSTLAGRVFQPGGVRVLEFLECISNVSGHGDVQKLRIIIPFEDDAAV